jgi:2-polyprenyl-3-methyl-5-hydroxy-6-metoxy-1,4-benzoquinol methylase
MLKSPLRRQYRRAQFSNRAGGWMISLGQRCRQSEIMDQPGLSPAEHAAALRGLARLNLFGSAGVLWPSLAALARRMAARPLRVIDFATGGGDIPVRLWKRARTSGISMEIEGCDVNPFAVQLANKAADKAGANIRFFVHDAVRGEPLRGYDAAICSTFLHHLDETEAIEFLSQMATTAPLVLVNDLERSIANYAMVYSASRVVTRSAVVHVDGLRSVAAAFTLAEVKHLAERAGLGGASVKRRWPCRYLLKWERP